MDNYLAELVKGRNILLAKLADTNLHYEAGEKLATEVEKHIEKIDQLIDQVMTKPRPTKVKPGGS